MSAFKVECEINGERFVLPLRGSKSGIQGAIDRGYALCIEGAYVAREQIKPIRIIEAKP